LNSMYCVYIVASASGVLYVGVTSDLERRVAEHKAGTVPGFASRYKCTRLVMAECCDNVWDALAREKQLKGWRRSKKAALISRENPKWEDLADVDVYAQVLSASQPDEPWRIGEPRGPSTGSGWHHAEAPAVAMSSC